MSAAAEFAVCMLMRSGDPKIYGSFEIDKPDVEAGVILLKRRIGASRFRPLAYPVREVDVKGGVMFPAAVLPSVSEMVWFIHAHIECKARFKIDFKALEIQDTFGKSRCPHRRHYLGIVAGADNKWLHKDAYRSSEFYGDGDEL